MKKTKITINDIPTESAHNNTTMRKKLIVTEDQKGKIATYNYAWLEYSKQLTPHAHIDGEEYYLFLKGKGEMLVGTEWFPVSAGDYVVIPHGAVHSLKNTHKAPLVFTAIRTIDEVHKAL